MPHLMRGVLCRQGPAAGGRTAILQTQRRAAFNRGLVKPGRLSRKHGELYNQLFRDRQEGDYIEFTVFDALYVQEKIEACEVFLAALRPLLTSLPHEP
jgi:hypothetical protein